MGGGLFSDLLDDQPAPAPVKRGLFSDLLDTTATSTYHRDRLAKAIADDQVAQQDRRNYAGSSEDWNSLKENAAAEAAGHANTGEEDAANRAENQRRFKANPPAPRAPDPNEKFSGPDDRSLWQQSKDLGRAGLYGARTGAYNAAAAIDTGLNGVGLVSDATAQNMHDLAKESGQQSDNLGGAQGTLATGAGFVSGMAGYVDPFLAPVMAGGQGRRDVLDATGNGVLANGDQTKANVVGLASAAGALAAGPAGRVVDGTIGKAAPALVRQGVESLVAGTAFMAPQPITTAVVAGADTRLQEQAAAGIQGLPESVAAMAALGMAPGLAHTAFQKLNAAKAQESVDAQAQQVAANGAALRAMEPGQATNGQLPSFVPTPREQAITDHIQQPGKPAPNELQRIRDEEEAQQVSDEQQAAPPAQSQAPRDLISNLREQEIVQQQELAQRQEAEAANLVKEKEALAQREREHQDVQGQISETEARLRQFDEPAAEQSAPQTPLEKAIAKRDAAKRQQAFNEGKAADPVASRADIREPDAIDAVREAGGIDMRAKSDELSVLPPALKRSVKSSRSGTSLDVLATHLFDSHGIGDGTDRGLSVALRRAHADRAKAAKNSADNAAKQRADNNAAKTEQAAIEAAIDSYRAGAPGGRAAVVKNGPYLTKEEAGVVAALKKRLGDLKKRQSDMHHEDAARNTSKPAPESLTLFSHQEAKADAAQPRTEVSAKKTAEPAESAANGRTPDDGQRVYDQKVSAIPASDMELPVNKAGTTLRDALKQFDPKSDPNGVEGNIAQLHMAATQRAAKAGRLPAPESSAKTAEPGLGHEPGGVAPGERIHKRPDLANVGETPAERDAVKAMQNEHNPEKIEDEAAARSAKELVDADPDGQKQRMLDAVRSGRAFEGKHEVAVMKEVLRRIYTTDPQSWAELVVGQQLMRTKTAQAFQSFADSIKSPAERMQEARGITSYGRKSSSWVKQLQDNYTAALADVARLSKAAFAPTDSSNTPPSRVRGAVKNASKALKSQWDSLVKEATSKRLRSVGGELGLVTRLAANLIARGVVKFADIALTITDHVRTMRYEADAHDLIDRAYDHLQAQDSKLAPRTENTADLVENDPRYTAEKKLERALAAHATLLKNLEQKVADYDAMSVEQRANFLRKEAARNELSPEAKKILDEQRKDVKGLREKLDSLTEEAQPELRKSLQDQIAIEEARIKKSEDALIDKRDRLMSMSEEEIRAEAESKRPPAEIAELRKASAERTKGVRDQIRELEHSDKAYTKANPAGAAKSPELKRAERIVAKLQKQLEKAKIIDAKDFERTKVAAKAEGFDVDNIEHWKDPETMTHYLNWLEGRNVSTLFALPKTLITWALHASAKVVPKKALADLIHVTNDAILKPIISPLVGSALHKLGAGREGMADVGEYRHTIPALFRGIMDGVTDALNVAKGMEPKFEAYAEHARVDPLLAKTSGTTWRRAAVRAGQWLSLLTPVRIVHAFASNIAARTKVAAHAYRQAVDSHGNRLKGQQLTDFMNREMENPKSESWRMAVLDAQRATYTEPLPKWLAKYSAWKSGHSKDSMVSNAWRLHAHSWTPFTQIPFNRGRRIASDWTPILSDAYTVIRFFSGKNEAGHDAAGKPKFERNLTKRDIPDAIVQAAVRWFLGYQAMQLVNTISADGHPVLIGDDKDKEKAFTIATGDGHRRKYLEAGSMGPGMGVFAGAAQGANSKIGPISGGLDSIVQLMSKEYQASLLQPILSVINSARYQPASRTTAEKAQAVIAETIGSKAAMLVPSIKGQIENAMADRKPDYTDSKKSNNFLDQVKHGAEVKASPGSLPRKGGEKDVDSAGWITFLDRLLNPMMLEGEKPKGKH